MRLYFEIRGYWKDDKSEFDGYIITNYDDVEEGGKFSEDEVFFYGLEETSIQEAIELGEDTMHDFVIEGYTKL